MSVEIPEFHKQHSLAMDTFGKMAMISNTDLEEDPKESRTAQIQIGEYRDAISTLSSGLSAFRGTIAGLPRMTTAFNRARRRAVAVLDDLLTQLRMAANQSQDVEQLLERMTDTASKGAQ